MLGIACSLEYFPDRNTNYKSNTKIENKSVVQYQHNYRNETGTVNKITNFGAFINIFPGVEALLPVAEM
ncbi:MAG: S1 RNA-binding domain-containing protein, partial [Ruminococcus sp.]|nr:S1 RNA-binding domain-containing protein [Ruminococcus sp.]